jgi:hypothetical protein
LRLTGLILSVNPFNFIVITSNGGQFIFGCLSLEEVHLKRPNNIVVGKVFRRRFDISKSLDGSLGHIKICSPFNISRTLMVQRIKKGIIGKYP